MQCTQHVARWEMLCDHMLYVTLLMAGKRLFACHARCQPYIRLVPCHARTKLVTTVVAPRPLLDAPCSPPLQAACAAALYPRRDWRCGCAAQQAPPVPRSASSDGDLPLQLADRPVPSAAAHHLCSLGQMDWTLPREYTSNWRSNN